jgi:hypothetical protein
MGNTGHFMTSPEAYLVVPIQHGGPGESLAEFATVELARDWIDMTRIAYDYEYGVAIECDGMYDFGDGVFIEWPD